MLREYMNYLFSRSHLHFSTQILQNVGDWAITVLSSNEKCDDDVHFVLDQNAKLYFYSARSMKKQSAGGHVAPLGHIILNSSQIVFVNAVCLAEKQQIQILNFVVFGLTRPGLEPTI